MKRLNSRDLTAIALCAALWGVLNSIFAPTFFRMTGLPILCDFIGFSVLTIGAWWIRKTGAITIIGLIATVINFIFNPGGFQFLGFMAASILFDASMGLVGYDAIFKKHTLTIISVMIVSTLSAALAGYLIGTFFMATPALIAWGGVFGWASLHAAGGIIGGAIGISMVTSLKSRKILT